jgi:hypothetical protein
MSGAWWIAAACLLLAFRYTMRFGSAFVEVRTGRESRPEPSTFFLSATLYFVLAFAIMMPPIFLWPDADPLLFSGFMMIGILVGDLASQALFGRKRDSDATAARDRRESLP